VTIRGTRPVAGSGTTRPPREATPFRVVEATIGDIQAAYRSRELSAVDLVRHYLDRIEAYDQRGPTINSIITIDPMALEEAARLDGTLKASGPAGPLHGVPVILKDQIDAVGTPTTLGSVLFKDFTPDRDAFIVERLRRAGAVILAKATLGELAGGDTHGSLFGSTRNPYVLDRTAGGSSGGPAASVSANFGAVGVGQEGYASLRRPAAWCCLAGMRASPGLVSRSGSYSGWPTRAGALGPMTRTVGDLATLLDVLVGYDADDPLTAYGVRRAPRTYTAFLDERGLSGARIGVLREAMGWETQPESADYAKVAREFDKSVEELTTAGATVVDPIVIPKLNELLGLRGGGPSGENEEAWRVYFGRSSKAPFSSYADMLGSPEYAKVLQRASWSHGKSHEEYLRARDVLMVSVLKLMADHDLDAIVHKTVEHQPQLLSQGIPPYADGYVDGRGSTHLNTFLIDVPAITVPAGFTSDALPVGITFFGRPYDDGNMIKLAYAYEQATKHRRPPTSTPPLPAATTR
jgi:Asp-tRNA(Asn)/Glu-tRNA(Gln) amidotransferase A subunit family amidase